MHLERCHERSACDRLIPISTLSGTTIKNRDERTITQSTYIFSRPSRSEVKTKNTVGFDTNELCENRSRSCLK